MNRGVTIVIGAAALAAGCTRTAPRVRCRRAEARIDDILDAAKTNDSSSIPDLVRQLDSDDPAVRMIAINTLERLTGERRGYLHYDPRWNRDEAVDRWVAWLAETETEASKVGASP